MKTFYKQLLFIPAMVLSILLGAHDTAKAGEALGFNVEVLPISTSGGNTYVTWKVTQETSQTGLSHFIIQDLCLPAGISGEVSSDGTNWTSVTITHDDGSTPTCQTGFGKFIKFSGANASRTNYYRLTIPGNYTLTTGNSIIKIGGGSGNGNGNGNGNNNNGGVSCAVVATEVPTLNFGAGVSSPASPISICEGSSSTLTAGYTGAGTYSWTKGTDVLSGKTGSSITVTESGTYTVTCVVNGCSSFSQSFVVVVTNKPVFTIVDGSVCKDGTLNLMTLVTSGSTSGSWSGTGVSGNIFTGSAVGEVNLTYTVTDGPCTVSKSVKVKVNALPTITATSDQTVCYNADVTLKGLSGGVSYEWDNGISNDVSFKATESKTYTVTGTDANGCKNTTTSRVTVNALPTITATSDQTVCYNADVTLKGLSGGVSYEWDNGISNDVSFKATESKTYTVTGTDANGCKNTTTSTVTVNPIPTVTTSIAPTICAGQNTTLTASGATSYVWTPGGEGASITVSPGLTTTYSVVGTSNGCTSAPVSVTVTVNSKPTLVITENKTICAGESVVLTVSGASSYVWSTGGNTASITVNPGSTTKYTVTGTNAQGCSTTAETTVTVNSCAINQTYTQGFYGNVGGKTCGGLTTSVLYSSPEVTSGFTSGLKAFGDKLRIFNLSIDDFKSNIYKLLPGGGTPAALSSGTWVSTSKGGGSPIDSKGKINNNLLSQTITLWINTRISTGLGGFVLPRSFTTAKFNCSSNSINYEDKKSFSVPSALANRTVNDLLDLANKALGNSLSGSDPSLNDIYTTIDLINNAFDQGRAVISSSNVVNSTISKSTDPNMMFLTAAIPTVVLETISAYPNPFNGSVTLTISPKVEGPASLEIYDASGLKVASLFNGNLKVGDDKRFEFNAPSGRGAQTYIYYFVQGDQILQGKLIGF